MSEPSADPSTSNFEPGKAVVISLARAGLQGRNVIVVCLDKSGTSDPFALRNQDGSRIWRKKELREIDIRVGSVISYQTVFQRFRYSGNTGIKVVSLALQMVVRSKERSIMHLSMLIT